jgi:hypothetical protein
MAGGDMRDSASRRENILRHRAQNRGFRLRKRRDLPGRFEVLDHKRAVLFVAELGVIEEFLANVKPDTSPRQMRKIICSQPRRPT